jgi:DASS family divalent anion:Na+ symporter
MQSMFTSQLKALLGIILATLVIYLALPVPQGLSAGAWQLALIFAVTILCVLANLLPIFTASIAALAVAVLSGVLTPAQAYRGFGESFILLIVAAFLVARAVVNSGLGHRMAWMIIARFGHSTRSLAYSLVATDLIIAPAFPSNTARSGVLFPIAESLAMALDSRPEPESRKRAGAYLMMVGMGSLSISSALWLTAMAANAAGVAIAREQGVEISFGSWLLTASVPCLAAAIIMPRLVYRFLPPELHQTPEAPAVAREKLQAMGPMSRQEIVTAVIFCAMVLLWALSDTLGIDLAAVAFGGLALLMLFGVFTISDLQHEGGTLEVLVWFAILYAMSTALNQMGFMSWLGQHFAVAVGGLSWPLVYVTLLLAYIAIHYFFVSQTAHLLALFPVFLEVGIGAGVPGLLMAYSILFATNYFSALTPQASSANIIFVGSGYLEVKEVYRMGLFITLTNTLIIGFFGVLWILFINR